MKKRFIGVVAAAALLLCSCGEQESVKTPLTSEPETSESVSDLPGGSVSDTGSLTIVTEDDSQPPEEGMVRSRLTNEWVSAETAATRPIAVMVANEAGAVPHYNLSEASVLYEANVEGRMTRLMAIYEGWQDLDKIGNVRSLRSYYAYWAFEWDAFIVHVGGPFFINELMAEPYTQDIDETSDSDAFFRSTDRSAPHNAYVSGKGLLAAVNRKGYSLKDRGLADSYHYRFTTKANPNALTQYGNEAEKAVYIDMSGCYPLTRCYFEYNEEDGLYYRFQHLSGSSDGPHVDASGKQLSFKNILVQNVKVEEIGEGYLAFQCHDTTRDGWYFTNGKGIHVTWEKTSDYGATRYYDDYGNEIVLNTGKTMVCIVEDGDNFTFR